MNNLDRLDYLMQRALQKVRSEQLRSVCDALRELLPDVLRTLRDISVAPEATSAQRLKAGEMILGIHQRVLAASLEDDRTQVLREKSRAVSEAARAERGRIKLEGRKADLAIAAKRRRMQRVLDRAAKQIEKQEAKIT